MSGYWPRRTAVFATKWPPENSARIYTIAWPAGDHDSAAAQKRSEDVPQLVNYFLRRAAERSGTLAVRNGAGRDAVARRIHWPGNVRELENIVTRASVLNLGLPIEADQLRDWLMDAPRNAPIAGQAIAATIGASKGIEPSLNLDEMERKLIEATLDRFDGHRAKTAETWASAYAHCRASSKRMAMPRERKARVRNVGRGKKEPQWIESQCATSAGRKPQNPPLAFDEFVLSTITANSPPNACN